MDNFGKKARDKVTGFEGIITAKCFYLFDRETYGISPPAKDGKLLDTEWFFVDRVEILDGDIDHAEVRAEKNGSTS